MHQRDGGGGRPEYLKNRAELLTADEALFSLAKIGLGENHAADNDHNERKPEREEATSRPVRSPAEAEPNCIEQNDAAQKHQHGCRNKFSGTHSIYLFLEQPAFGHQITVELFVLFHPLYILSASGEGRLERAIFEVFFEFRRFV